MSAGKQSRDLNQVLSENQGKVLNKRTRLHTRDIVFWLRKRFLNKNPNMNYLFFPEELQKHYEVDKIFKKFDEDGSGKLDFNEFYDMLVATGINIDIEDLREFYKRADEDHDLAFDFKEFKNCTLSEEANYHFANMMNKVRKAYEEQERNQILEADEEDAESSPKESPEKKEEDGEEEHEHEGEGKKKIKRKPYLPRTFGNLLNYITYTNRKRELTDFLNDDSLRRSDRFGTFKELIDLKIGKDVYLAKYYERFKFLERTETVTHRSKQDLNDLASAINSVRRSTLSSTVAGSANRAATEEDDIHKEIEALEQQGRSDALEQFEKRKLRLLRFKSSSPTTVRSEIKTATPKTNRVVVKKIEQKSSSFKGLHAKNFASATDGFKVLKIPNLNLKNPSLIPENAGRLLSSSSRDNNTQPNTFKEKRTNSFANQTDARISLIKLQNLQGHSQNQDTSTTQNSKSPVNTFARYIKEVKTEPDIAVPQGEKKLVKNYLRYAENPKNSSPLLKAELHLEGNEAMSTPSESSVSFQDLAKRRKFQASFGIPLTKVSKMPSFYNNYSSTFDNYVTTPDTLASTRLTTTPTDGIYPSPRTMKITSSPLRAHPIDLKTPSSAGTFFKSSVPPSRSINLYQVSRKNSENKNVMPTGGSLISVTGNKANKNVKSKSVRLIMTGLPEVKRDKKL